MPDTQLSQAWVPDAAADSSGRTGAKLEGSIQCGEWDGGGSR